MPYKNNLSRTIFKSVQSFLTFHIYVKKTNSPIGPCFLTDKNNLKIFDRGSFVTNHFQTRLVGLDKEGFKVFLINIWQTLTTPLGGHVILLIK